MFEGLKGFEGIADIDWSSMNHAYADASDVPGMLHGLTSADAAERDIALDGMYGAVHHQGDVYDSTVACIPFLFAVVAAPQVADRGAVLGLLCSIAGDEDRHADDIDVYSDDEEENAAWIANFLDAQALVRSRAGSLLPLLDDPDPDLRGALPGALAVLHSDPVRVLDALRERLAVEGDEDVIRSLVAGIGELGVRHRELLGRDAGQLLRELLGRPSAHPGARLSCLIQLARCAPELLPPDTVDIAHQGMLAAYNLEAMREAYGAEWLENRLGAERIAAIEEAWRGADERPEEPGRPRTDTMVSYLRDLAASRTEGVGAPWANDLMRDLHLALGDRTEERCALLVEQLDSLDWRQRMEAVEEAGRLLTGWRPPNDLPVAMLARQLAEKEESLARDAARELAYISPACGAVADVLFTAVEEWYDTWEERWYDSSFGSALKALALLGDARAVPYLDDVLEYGGIPEGLDGWVEALGDAAAPLGDVLHRRLAGLAPEGRSEARGRLVDAVGVLRVGESLPLVVRALESD
ncbi:HEAT repeat domain-containing protein, partial [Streptomyces sp. T-3]|nr:HEAT repeat domain-containing protein [Streptomyces sp. T-3]